MEFLADIYLLAGLVFRPFGLKRLSKRLKEKGDALLERCTAEVDQARREQEAREEKARKHREEAVRSFRSGNSRLYHDKDGVPCESLFGKNGERMR